MEKKDTEKQFERHITENELLIYKVCRIYAYTDADRQDLFQDIVQSYGEPFPILKVMQNSAPGFTGLL